MNYFHLSGIWDNYNICSDRNTVHFNWFPKWQLFIQSYKCDLYNIEWLEAAITWHYQIINRLNIYICIICLNTMVEIQTLTVGSLVFVFKTSANRTLYLWPLRDIFYIKKRIFILICIFLNQETFQRNVFCRIKMNQALHKFGASKELFVVYCHLERSNSSIWNMNIFLDMFCLWPKGP